MCMTCKDSDEMSLVFFRKSFVSILKHTLFLKLNTPLRYFSIIEVMICPQSLVYMLCPYLSFCLVRGNTSVVESDIINWLIRYIIINNWSRSCTANLKDGGRSQARRQKN